MPISAQMLAYANGRFEGLTALEAHKQAYPKAKSTDKTRVRAGQKIDKRDDVIAHIEAMQAELNEKLVIGQEYLVKSYMEVIELCRAVPAKRGRGTKKAEKAIPADKKSWIQALNSIAKVTGHDRQVIVHQNGGAAPLPKPFNDFYNE